MLKECVTSAPLRTYPQLDKLFILNADASNKIVGGLAFYHKISSIRNRPIIVYWCKCLSKLGHNAKLSSFCQPGEITRNRKGRRTCPSLYLGLIYLLQICQASLSKFISAICMEMQMLYLESPLLKIAAVIV